MLDTLDSAEKRSIFIIFTFIIVMFWSFFFNTIININSSSQFLWDINTVLQNYSHFLLFLNKIMIIMNIIPSNMIIWYQDHHKNLLARLSLLRSMVATRGSRTVQATQVILEWQLWRWSPPSNDEEYGTWYDNCRGYGMVNRTPAWWHTWLLFGLKKMT